MLNFGPDGLSLGPAVLNWQNLSLVLGILAWLGLARFAAAQNALLITLTVARVVAVWPGLALSRPLLENLLDLVDLRRGGWAWIPGLIAGAVFIVLRARPDWQKALPAALGTLLAGSLPLLLKPAPQVTVFPAAEFTLLGGQTTPLPRPAVINFWATWCGPCRSEMPMLLAEAQNDPHLILLNVGESAPTVGDFVKDNTVQVRLGGEKVTGPLRVSGFPTTLAINASGEIVARHLGPLTRAGLLELRRQAFSEQ